MAKTLKPKRKKNVEDLATEVSSRIQIKNIKLINCKCEQLPNTDKGSLSIDISYEVTTKTDKTKNTIVVFPKFTLKAMSETNEEKKTIVLIEATFLAVYVANNFEGLTEDNFDEFGKMNGVYNTWPYWREFVQNMISRMDLPKLVLPVFRFGSQKPQTEQKKK